MTGPTLRVIAPAKINLTLHVTGRRADGYHLLDSIVAFARLGDVIEISPAESLSLSVRGPFASDVPLDDDNLVLKAARAAGLSARITLEKNLPVASGIGGGSADAAAVLRAAERLTGRPAPPAAALGADVPVCVASEPARMRGVGEILSPLPRLPPMPLVLANPGAPVRTADVFCGLASVDGAPMPDEIPEWPDARATSRWLAEQRNDLEAPALTLAPGIGRAIRALAACEGCLLSRMSGSGATVFGIFPANDLAVAASRRLRRAHPEWWIEATELLGGAPASAGQESRLTT